MIGHGGGSASELIDVGQRVAALLLPRAQDDQRFESADQNQNEALGNAALSAKEGPFLHVSPPPPRPLHPRARHRLLLLLY